MGFFGQLIELVKPYRFRILLALVAALVGFTWLSHQIAVERAEAAADATKKAQDEVISYLDEREKERREQLDRILEQLEQVKRQVRQPRDIVREIPAYIRLPKPIELQGSQNVPPPPMSAVVPPESVKPLFDHLVDCRACEVRLAEAQQTIRDDQRRMEAMQKKLEAEERKHRLGFKQVLKWLVIGGAGGYVAGRIF